MSRGNHPEFLSQILLKVTEVMDIIKQVFDYVLLLSYVLVQMSNDLHHIIVISSYTSYGSY